MKNIKAKIERVEKETKRIEAIDKLIKLYDTEHLKPVTTYLNGGTFGQCEAVVIDKNIMIQMLAEQKLTIELEIEADVKFIAAIELLVSPEQEQPVAIQSPAPTVAPLPPSAAGWAEAAAPMAMPLHMK